VPLIGHEADVVPRDPALDELAHRGLRLAEVVDEPDDSLRHSASLLD
jgi:hypothetical protein